MVKKIKIWLIRKPKLKYYVKYQENHGFSELYCGGKLSFNFSLQQSCQAHSNRCLEPLVPLATGDFPHTVIIPFKLIILLLKFTELGRERFSPVSKGHLPLIFSSVVSACNPTKLYFLSTHSSMWGSRVSYFGDTLTQHPKLLCFSGLWLAVLHNDYF